ncbi:hypothetical protein SDC9_137569 [bioreactor metagenome]|uniref:Uncharacterized protein n=1 Tax=bioreactor metagenome TaxID=1076179 RepID=A0A645DMX2_9ZZZZ
MRLVGLLQHLGFRQSGQRAGRGIDPQQSSGGVIKPDRDADIVQNHLFFPVGAADFLGLAAADGRQREDIGGRTDDAFVDIGEITPAGDESDQYRAI